MRVKGNAYGCLQRETNAIEGERPRRKVRAGRMQRMRMMMMVVAERVRTRKGEGKEVGNGW